MMLFMLTVVGFALIWNLLPVNSEGGMIGKACKVPTSVRMLNGECTLPQDCSAILSDLSAGIDPKICGFQNNALVVCCPKDTRKSEEVCAEYKLEMMKPTGPVPLLPIEFLETRAMLVQKEIWCKKHSPPKAMIVGGRNAGLMEFPHMVALGFGKLEEKMWHCGGTLISTEFVLTAAHCVNSSQKGPVQRAMLGTINLREGDERIRSTIIDIAEIIPHPGYTSPITYNDIALLRLQRKVTLSEKIFPACLPSPNFMLENIKEAQVTGWGYVETGGAQSEILQAVTLHRMPQDKCEETFKDKPRSSLRYPQGILKSQFCADGSKEHRDSCKGDSGGPLTVTREGQACLYYIVGVVSFGSDFCGFEPGVYTNVQSYLNWIEEIVWPVGT